MANQIFSVLGNCCNSMLIGKTFWKGLALPCLLYGTETISFNKTEIQNLQRLDNKAFRHILGVHTSTAVEFIRGEVGASSAKSRDAKTKILFIKHALNEKGNQLLSTIVRTDLQQKKTDWSKAAHQCLQEYNLNLNTVVNKEKEFIIRKINDKDETNWKESMSSKKSLNKYSKYKNKIEEIKWLRNGFKYKLLMRARGDALNIFWRRTNPQDKICKLCNREEETLKHFILDCPMLQNQRNRYILLQLPR